MRKLLIISIVLISLVGCAADPSNATPNQPVMNTENEQVGQEATSGPDCYGSEIHPVGQSIAKQFEDETSYDQVMVWFCNGALFDDILTALQTEKLSGESANQLLQMQAGGLTWDQIWLEIGLTEE